MKYLSTVVLSHVFSCALIHDIFITKAMVQDSDVQSFNTVSRVHLTSIFQSDSYEPLCVQLQNAAYDIDPDSGKPAYNFRVFILHNVVDN